MVTVTAPTIERAVEANAAGVTISSVDCSPLGAANRDRLEAIGCSLVRGGQVGLAQFAFAVLSPTPELRIDQ
jgi:hypothetical protein